MAINALVLFCSVHVLGTKKKTRKHEVTCADLCSAVK